MTPPPFASPTVGSAHPLEPARTAFRRWRASPSAFLAEALQVEPEPWQRRALTALVRRDRLAIRSGHGVGKSAFLAWTILWWLATRFPAKVACTAPTAHQLQDILWGELAKWRRRLPDLLQAELLLRDGRMELASAPTESFAVARTARRDQPEAFQGFHSEHMLFVVDEASGVDDAIFEAGQGAMSTAGAKTLLCGNPTRCSGTFFDAFHKDRAGWWTARVSCLDSARVSPAYAEEMAARHGTDSAVYRVRVLGEFPQADNNAVIPLDLAEAALHREVDALPVRAVWGVDVARFGADRSALARRVGNVLLRPVESWQGRDTMQLAGLVAAEFEGAAEDERPAEIVVDVIGLGAGVVDRLRELGLPARGVNVAEAASVEGRYARLRDELWFRARSWLEARDCRLAGDGALVAELSTVRYGLLSNGRIKVEGKEEMKRRGLRSPDLADAFVLTFAAHDRKVVSDRAGARTPRRRGGWMGA